MRIIRLALLYLLTAFVLTSSPASAGPTSASCPAVDSTRIAHGTLLGSDYMVWLYQPPAGKEILLCFVLPFGVGSGAVQVSLNGLVPTVAVGEDPAACTEAVFDISNPVRLRLATSRERETLCIKIGAATLTIKTDVAKNPPTTEVWRDGTGSLLDLIACKGDATCARMPGRVFP